MNGPQRRALDEIGDALDRIADDEVERTIEHLARARRIVLHGVGREGLQMKGFAMRLFHLGLNVGIVGDMTAPAVGTGDVVLVSAGPGGFATIEALMRIAGSAGASVILVTAEPDGSAAALADAVLTVPAQTMANDRGGASVLPMGSLYEGALFVLFEMLVLALRDRLGVAPEAMRANHTNME